MASVAEGAAMSDAFHLPARAEARLAELGSADLVIGIPSFNNARTIAHVVRAAAAGLAKHFPGQRGVIVNSDGGSRDGTPEAVSAAQPASPGRARSRAGGACSRSPPVCGSRAQEQA